MPAAEPEEAKRDERSDVVSEKSKGIKKSKQGRIRKKQEVGSPPARQTGETVAST